ncbi:MAG TPA: 2,3-bisphosphoglycerate-dependent phosphoglycerate mutase [bacterium]|jgi:2,3-bisphosphoglycerate-dependent phosphoglycerate mutase|nr:2,3-bisphosphoglycerate-dependent phosphoglycerate mutase [bacterium]
MPTLVLVRHGQSQWNLENRFTGWVDVPLTAQGEKEAHRAGQLLKGLKFDIAFTSDLQRAQKTLAIVLQEIGQMNLPILKDEALNERHYGALQGLDKTETAKKYGDEQVKIWRRSYDVPPPKDDKGFSESLQDTAARTLPYFDDKIVPYLKEGKNVIVAAHGNSLRSIVMHLEHLTKEQVLELNLDTAVPRVYELDKDLKILSSKDLR